MFANPVFANTNTIDYAGMAPHIVVRSGTPEHRTIATEPTLAFSTDFGHSWSELRVPPVQGEIGRPGDAAVVTTADGSAFIVMTHAPSITRDQGNTWTSVSGLPFGLRVVADRVNARHLYAMDFETSTVFGSVEGGMSFVSLQSRGLPDDLRDDRPRSPERPWPLSATPGRAGTCGS
jgi:xyloglucan-specific exo-beta-1,4-glucanase